MVNAVLPNTKLTWASLVQGIVVMVVENFAPGIRLSMAWTSPAFAKKFDVPKAKSEKI